MESVIRIGKREKIKRTLGIRKFDSVLFASALESIVSILIAMSDTAITGHIVGEKGLSAMNVVSPIISFTIFLEGLFSVGTCMLYARYLGKFEKESAEKTFGMGLEITALTGIIMFLLVRLALPFYTRFLGIHGEVLDNVNLYMRFLSIKMMISPLFALVSQMVLTDGAEYLSMAAETTRSVMNVVLSFWLGRHFGIAGIGMGTLISLLLGALVLVPHFFSKHNSLYFKLSFHRRDFLEILLFGWNDSAMFFVMPILFFLVNKYVMMRFGEYYLPCLAVLYSVIEFTDIFEATGEALRALLPIYVGDKNPEGIKRLSIHSLRVNLVMGLASGVLLLATAGLMPNLFDLTDPGLVPLCVRGLRIYAFGWPMLSLLAMFNSYYLNAGKPSYAMYEMILVQLVCPLAALVPANLVMGFPGIFAGFAISPYLSALILFVTLRLPSKKKGFPIYLKDADSISVLFDGLTLTPEKIVAFTKKTEAFLRERGVGSQISLRVQLSVEDGLMAILERHIDEEVFAECCVRSEPGGVNLSIWDSGGAFDMGEEDAPITSFRSFIVNSLMENIGVKKNMVVSGLNRSSFYFPLIQ